VACRLYDRIKETTSSSGTGSVTLAGTSTGYRTFGSVCSTGDLVQYLIINRVTGEWETGFGTFSSVGPTLNREYPDQSSNANAIVNFAVGSKDVIISAISVGANVPDAFLFGTGLDGAYTPSSGTTTLTKDMHYTRFAPTGTAVLVNPGFRIYVSEITDLSAAPAGAIVGIANNNAGNGAAQTTGGTIGAGYAGVNMGGGGAGSVGGAGGTTTGVQAAAPTNQAVANGGAGGLGAAGGLGSSGAGGIARAGATVALPLLPGHFETSGLRGVTLITGGGGGAGGGGGGGDGTQGGGGGGGGGGAGHLWMSTRLLYRQGAVAGVFKATGGTGGNGGSPAAGSRGGGGVGGGGGGGQIDLHVGAVFGTAAPNALDASGGAGGVGGTGRGTGVGGNGGTGGTGGAIFYCILGSNQASLTTGTAGSTGGAASGTTGGTSGAAGVCRVSL